MMIQGIPKRDDHRIGMPLFPAERNGRRYVNPVPTRVGGLSLMFKMGPRFFFGAAARSPRHSLGPFHTDPRVYTTGPESGLRITWLGHASSLVEIDGVRVLVDPLWDERAAPTQWAGPKRFFPPPLPLEDLPPLDAVLISHDHYDHLGAGTIQRLARIGSQRQVRWITTMGVGAILSSLGVDPSRCTELNWMDNIKVGALNITAFRRATSPDAASSIVLKRYGRPSLSQGPNTASITAQTQGAVWLP